MLIEVIVVDHSEDGRGVPKAVQSHERFESKGEKLTMFASQSRRRAVAKLNDFALHSPCVACACKIDDGGSTASSGPKSEILEAKTWDVRVHLQMTDSHN